MGDQNTVLSENEIRHALRRTGFGPSARDWKRASKKLPKPPLPTTRGDVADYVLGLKTKDFRPKGNEDRKVHDKWLKWLIKGRTPFQNRMVLFWHDHFSTSASVVDDPDRMSLQVQHHYVYSLGNFKDYVKAINLDPAMMVFLDTVRNRKEIPNENYARELCELFTLGVTDLLGVANYLQEDVVQIARAFTGWRLDGLDPYLQNSRHDFDAEYGLERGPKILFDDAYGFPVGGASFTTGGEGANEIDEVVDILFQHQDSEGKNTVARRTAYRLLEYFAYASPELSVVDEVVASSSFDVDFEIAPLMREILVHDAFYETAALPPYSATTKKSVKWPVDYVVSTLRLLNMKPRGGELELTGGDYLTLLTHMEKMGQTIGEPPSVFGWEWEAGWLSSSTLLARYSFARDIVNARDKKRFKPEKLVDIGLTVPGDIVDAVTDSLGVSEFFTSTERDKLIDYLTDEGLNGSIDLTDFDTRNTKLHGLFLLVMQSPAYQLH